MNVGQRLLQLSPVSFKQPPKTQTAPSSIPYRICSSRKATKLPPKPTRNQTKPTEPLINYGSVYRAALGADTSGDFLCFDCGSGARMVNSEDLLAPESTDFFSTRRM